MSLRRLLFLDGPYPRPFRSFRLLEKLAEGGMGATYRASDPERGREVVLKIPFPKHAERFQAEAAIGLALNHPNCCRVEDFYPGDGAGELSYLVMPYLRGGTLQARLAGEGRMPGRAAAIALSLARTLADLHRRGITHRDLKDSNILFIAPEDDEPILADFGLAIRLGDPAMSLPKQGVLEGTRRNLAPEQIAAPTPDTLTGPSCDIWALGIVLYQMLAGRHPFSDGDVPTVARQAGLLERFNRLWRGEKAPAAPAAPDLLEIIRSQEPPPLPADVPPALAAVCRKALAKGVHDRYATAAEMARDLASAGGSPAASARPMVPASAIRFDFVPHGTAAPKEVREALYLDVGGDLRAGVIDHHQIVHYPGSTASMLAHRLELIDLAVGASRSPADPFAVVLHRQPDLDGAGSAYLARAYLATGRLPAGSEALCRYLDAVDAGRPGFSLAQPFTPYTAFRALLARSAKDEAGWREALAGCFTMFDRVLASGPADQAALLAADAFDVPGVFDAADRAFVADDAARYEEKMADPARAERVTLHLPRQAGPGTAPVAGLLARHVQDEDDDGRVVLFKDWARTDAGRAGSKPGFVALSVFMALKSGRTRAIVSVTPGSGASLRGLGKLLEDAEAKKRAEMGQHDRDFKDGARKPPRFSERGEASSGDPWYDGRAHNYTIIDAPGAGSVLTAGEVEAVVREYGAG
jgi:serine/threonine protein kinase